MPGPSQRSVVLALGTGQTLAWASSTYLPAVLASAMARDLGISRATVFGAFSVSLLVMAAAGPWVGRVIDRSGGRNMLMGSNLMFALGLLLLGLSQQVTHLFAAWCILGLAMAMGLYDAAFATLVRLYGAAARQPIVGITLMGGFASTVGWPLSAYMDAQIGWRAACFVWAGLHLVLALPLTWRVLPARAAAGAAGTARDETQGEPVVALAAARSHTAAPAGPGKDADTHTRNRRRNFALLGLYFASTAFVTSAYAAHLPALLTALGAGAAGALLAAALLGPAQVAARLLEFGVISRYRVHALVTARIATALHPMACVLLLLLGGPPMLAALFALLHGAGNGMITIAKGTLPLALFGAVGYGLTQGWLAFGARLMQASAPYAFALVLDGWGGQAALLLSGGLSLLALAALLLLRQPQRAASA